MLRVAFFGNSQSVFSNRHFHALRLRMARIDQEHEKSLPQLCRELGLEQGDCLV